MMGRRRGGARGITGPQSALTDFLASHNISAAQIASDYAARQAAAESEAGPSNAVQTEQHEDEDAMELDEEEEKAKNAKKRKREEAKTIAKIKKSKEFARKKAGLKGEPGEDDDDGLAFDMFEKSKIIPGQMDNCEECSKRFTVTPYTKEGPDGGLLCAKCGKIQEDAKKKAAKVKKPALAKGKRNKAQSNLMEGQNPQGSRSLLDMCVERVAKSIDDIDDFGDIPPLLYDRLSMILSKYRVLDSRTVDLFLQPENNRVAVYDAGKLRTDDFIRIFQICPTIQKVDLRNAGQLKDKVIDFILERKVPIEELRLNATNLITDDKWQQFFAEAGSRLTSLQLSWLDFAMTNPSLVAMVTHCKNLTRLKLKRCFHMDDESLAMLSGFENLEHLSLSLPNPTSPDVITALVNKVGIKLESLCLRDFTDADDLLIEAIAATCTRLKKLVIMNNDRITDDAYTALFTAWSVAGVPPLERALFASSRETEGPSGDASGPEPVIGFSSNAFTALMLHSGSALQKISLASCRSISHEALLDAFDGTKTYPCLAEIDVSFVSGIDTVIIAGIFKSCPNLTKLVAFGCFDVEGVRIPRGVALIGVPAAQEGIVQEGDEQ